MKTNRLVTLAFASIVAVAPAAHAVANGSIAVYLDGAGTQCQGPISGLVIGSVWMNLGGATAPGITGAEFRIDNSNSSAYDVSFSADPGVTISIGNPFLGGCNVAFAACQTGTAGRVKLGNIFITEMASTPDVLLTVRPHYTPSNPSPELDCVLATACDAPFFTSICVGAVGSDHWRAVINPTGAIAGDCQPVAVQATSWTTVKALYQH
jgi:hypothetical protein